MENQCTCQRKEDQTGATTCKMLFGLVLEKLRIKISIGSVLIRKHQARTAKLLACALCVVRSANCCQGLNLNSLIQNEDVAFQPLALNVCGMG